MFQAKQHVCVKGSTAVAEFVEILDNGYAKVKWLDEGGGVNWRNEFPLNELTALSSRRQRRTTRHLQEEEVEVPTKKKKKKLNKIVDKDSGKKTDGPDKKKRELDDDTVTTELTAGETSRSESSVTKARTDELSGNAPNKTIETTENEQEAISDESDDKPATAPDLWQVIGLEKDRGLKLVAKLLPEGSEKCAEQVIHFFLFCYERQMVWERRNRDERITSDGYYYTESWAMQMYFFCNNYRELDRGTCYFREHILNLWDMHQKDGHVDDQTWMELVLWATTCYRLVNRISTFDEYGGIPSIDEWPLFQTFLREKEADGEVIFTDAHTLCCGLTRYVSNMNKLCKNDGKLVKEVSSEILECCKGERDEILKQCFEKVKKVDGIGAFFAWQVTCDLHESQCLADSNENDWTELGPGAESGIKLIFEDSKCDARTHLELAVLLQSIQDDVYDALGLKFPKWNGLPLTLKNIEHPLCDFKKYIAIQEKLQAGYKPKGQRLIKSRTGMDIDKACHYVEKCGECDDILLCDKCLVGFCNECAGPRDESCAYWVCPRCTAHEYQRRGKHEGWF